jgi:protein gp37
VSAKTSIEWTDYSWNPVSGCDKVSPGCDHCYAETIATRFAGTKSYPDGFKVTLKPERLTDPLRKRSWHGKHVFVNSMSDLFHKDVPDDYIARVFAVMALAPEITFQILTKRHGRMQSLLDSDAHWHRVGAAMTDLLGIRAQVDHVRALPNVWLGVSVEDQRRADLRIPRLAQTPAAVRFLSCEPLLGRVDLRSEWLDPLFPAFDWVIVGGESGRGARPMHPDWARTLRDQCIGAGVPFHFKQWGEWVPEDQSPEDAVIPATYRFDEPTGTIRLGKKASGRELDGRTWDEWPVMDR